MLSNVHSLALRLALFLGLLLLATAHLNAIELTLNEAITLARRQSVASAVARNRLRAAYWRYKASRADILPEVAVGGTLPQYKRLFNLHQAADGSYTYVRTNMIQANAELSITQRIPFTGGTIALSSSLDALKPLTEKANPRYLTMPIGFTLNQPLFAANLIKWEQRIEPVRYREQQMAYLSEVERLTQEAITHYFNLLSAATRLESARQNLANAEKLFAIAKIKRANGDLSANGERQLQLTLIDAQSTLSERETNWRASMFALQNFLGLPDTAQLDVRLPQAANIPSIAWQQAWEYAQANNAFKRRAERMRLEASQAVAIAKGERWRVDLVASVGYTGQDATIPGSYRNPIDYQDIRIGIRIPILDWGKRSGQLKMAQWDKEVIASQLEQEEQQFRQDLFILVERFNQQDEQVELACQADTVAEQRYQSSVKVFIEGKMDVLELNDAQLTKDRAREQRIHQLHRYWIYFYSLRTLTLHDFSGQYPIELEVEQVIR